jgi:1,2-phenylacetyl-CoA epoxidase catalytic subunit
MTAIEIKKEINKALDQVPEKFLVDILDLIKEVQLEKSSYSTLASNLKKILSEDSDLLHKLAQ